MLVLWIWAATEKEKCSHLSESGGEGWGETRPEREALGFLPERLSAINWDGNWGPVKWKYRDSTPETKLSTTVPPLRKATENILGIFLRLDIKPLENLGCTIAVYKLSSC